jgi:hypothetical protein
MVGHRRGLFQSLWRTGMSAAVAPLVIAFATAWIQEDARRASSIQLSNSPRFALGFVGAVDIAASEAR